MALTHDEAQRMIQAQARADRVLMVGYNTRAMGSWRTIKRLLDPRSIGTLRQIIAAAYIDARIVWQEMPLSDNLQSWFASSELLNAIGSDVLGRENWRNIPEIIGGGMFADTAPPSRPDALARRWFSGSGSCLRPECRQPIDPLCTGPPR